MPPPPPLESAPVERPFAWEVGGVVVSAIEEQELDPGAGAWLMPDLTADQLGQADDLVPDYIRPERTLRLDSHSYAFEVEGLKVVVDTGVGNGKTRDNPAWHQLNTDYLGALRRAGFAPESVDLIVLTHLHTDHVGWNTTWDGSAWQPTFPTARHVVAAPEWRYWQGMELEPARAAMFADSIQPVFDAGLMDLVDLSDGEGIGVEIAPGLRLVPAPGHTPGQVMVRISSVGQHAVITGDAVHHPIQILHPEVTTRADIDPPTAVATRRRLLGEAATDHTLVLGTHFAHSSAGFVDSSADVGFRWVPCSGGSDPGLTHV